MSLSITVPPNYGYPILLALAGIPILSFVQGTVVGKSRKAAQVPYPNAYATPEQVKSNDAAYKFNCAQRAHSNLLESVTPVTAQILFAGLFYPNATTVVGGLWIVFRAMFAYGYITSTPGSGGKKRYMGGGFWLCQVGLIGMSVAGALKLI